MATEEELFSFENALHFGFLAVSGLTAFPLLYPEDATPVLPDEYVFVKFDGFTETGHYGFNSSSVPVADQWTCQAVFTVVTKRLERADFNNVIIPSNHSQMRARLRQMLQRGRTSSYSLNTYLSDHEIESLTLAGTNHTFDPDPGSDISVISYDVLFGVKPSSWP